MPPVKTLVLNGGGLRVEQVLQAMRGDLRLEASAAVRSRIVAAQAVVESAVRSDQPVYGLTAALGANSGQAIGAAERQGYQARAIRARAVAVGPCLPEPMVRALLFVRLAGMAMGGSGVSLDVFDALLRLFNAGVIPLVPDTGSIGVADLPQMSHAMLVLMGEGFARVGGMAMTGAEALSLCGLQPVAPGAKDGLALISANAFSVAGAVDAFDRAAHAHSALELAAALTMEGFRANLSPLDPRVMAARPAPGQLQSADRLRELLRGSDLWLPGVARRLQDPLSIRCVPQIHGPVLWAMSGVRQHIECELNGAGDSPLVLTAPDALLSSSNFHIPGLALSLESLGLALAQAASASVQRCQRLYSPATSGLPLQLTRHGPQHSGFATAQKTLTALWNEIRHLANPAQLDFFPVSEGVEDHAPMAPYVAAKTARLADRVLQLAAIEMLGAAQALDLAGHQPKGAGTATAYRMLRETVPMLDEDRPMGADFDQVVELLKAGWLADEDALP